MQKKSKIYTIKRTIRDKYYLIPKRYRYFILILIAIPCILIGSTLAKYVYEDYHEKYLLSKEFYFESTVLNGSTYNLNDWDGEEEYSFSVEVKNFIDELRWTAENITYEVSVECQPSISGAVSCGGTNGTIIYNPDFGTSNKIPITLTNLNSLDFVDNDYVMMRVSVSSTNPYSKTLTADYKINVKTKKISYSIKDSVNNEYLEFILQNNTSTNQSVTVGWNHQILTINNLRKVVVDADIRTYVSNGITYINGFTTTMTPKSSYIFRYVKSNPSVDYTYPNGGNNSIITVTKN